MDTSKEVGRTGRSGKRMERTEGQTVVKCRWADTRGVKRVYRYISSRRKQADR